MALLFQVYLPDTIAVLADVSQLKGVDGYGVARLFRCLLLQIMEDLSDRDLARYLEENLAAKWFCGFTLSDPTPDDSLFTLVAPALGRLASPNYLPRCANSSKRWDS